MLIMGLIGYALRKFDFDPAPLVLGLVIAPLFEQSLRQSLIMSNGNYLIFLSRPIALGLLVVSACLLALSAVSFALKRRDWRAELAEAEAGGVEP
jgi:putative tricarboxylic transport membrane protein